MIPGPPQNPSLRLSPIVLRDIASDKDDPYHEPDNEPSIAINPVNPKEISVVAFSGNWGAELGIAAPVWKSFDGGLTWAKLPLIPPPGRLTLAPPIGRTVTLAGPYDQSLAYDSAGRLIVAEMGIDPDQPATPTDRRPFTMTILYRQTGGPRDPLAQTSAVFGDGSADQPIVSSGAGPCTARTHNAWLNMASQLSMHSLASNDAVSSLPAAGSNEHPTRTTRLAIDRSGSNAAYLIYKARNPPEARVESVSFRVRRSDDCGASWNALGGQAGIAVHGARTVRSLYTEDFAGLQPLGLTFQPRAKSSDAWITVHGATGHVYVAHLDVTDRGISRIVMARSIDKGNHWVSANVTDGTAMSAYPEIAVNSEGVIGVLFIDFTGAGMNLTFRHRLALSADQGRSWDFATLQTMTVRQLFDAGLKLEAAARRQGIKFKSLSEVWGDFEALTAMGSTFYGVFTGASIDRPLTDLDPIFFTVDAHAVPPGTPEPPGPVSPAPPVVPAPANPSPSPPLPPTARSYTVVKGDSLWRIAKTTSPAHKGSTWRALYELNRKIIKRPRLIKPKQELQLPW